MIRVLEAFGEPISFGGQESFVMNVLENMDRTDISVDFLSPYYCDNERIGETVRAYGGQVYALGCEFRPGRFRNAASGPIRRFLGTHKYDVIHIHSGSNSMLGMYARLAKYAGIGRIIVHSHCTGIPGWKHFAAKLATSYSLRKFPDVYCACSREAGEWRFPADICRNKLHVINNGIDIERFRYNEEVRESMRAKLGISDDEILIGNVGRLTYQKNQSFLIDVLGDLADPGQSPYRLILIGEGEDHEALVQKINDLGLSCNAPGVGDEGRTGTGKRTNMVIFAGTVGNVQDYLQAIDVLVLPSRYEGLAIAAVEAQAAGLETVVSEAIPQAAAITDGVTRLHLSDKKGWIAAIGQSHARHPEQADQVARAGYDIRDTAAVVRKIYTEQRTR